jgi:DNA primase
LGLALIGFLVHGADAVLWTAYVSGGATPRGRDFVDAVRELAGRAGVDPAPLERPQPRDRRAELLHDVFVRARRELTSERGATARAYLEERGFPPDTIPESDLGVVPERRRLAEALARAGYAPLEIRGSGVLVDSRWQGRIVGCWRDEFGDAKTLWARATGDGEPTGSKYLYLRAAPRTGLPPYGLSRLLATPPPERREIVLVEGVMDVHMLRAHGIQNVCALGGTASRPDLFERLARLGVGAVTLCFDNDPPGRSATARAVEASARAAMSPAILVIEPSQLAPAKDADAFVRFRGSHGWMELLNERACGVTWRATELVRDVDGSAPTTIRRSALARAGTWLGSLPARLSLEQEDAIRTLAARLGYSPVAVERAYRARFWRESHERAVLPQHDRVVLRTLER